MSDLDFSDLSQEDLLKTLDKPAIDPPEGVTPNFEHPENQNTLALAALITCLIVASTFLLIRVYVIFFKMRRARVGDYLILLAYACYLVICSGLFLSLSGPGFFVHQWDVHGRDIYNYLKFVLLGAEFWLVGILIVKASILLEWLRIFAPVRGQTYFTISCRSLIAVNVLSYSAIILALNLSCRPFQKIWDKTLPGTCIDIKKVHLSAAAVNLVLNTAILVLPQRIIWSLRMSTTKKIGVSTVFTIGLLSMIASIFLLKAVVDWSGSRDMTYYHSAVNLWAVAELTGGMLVFCVPVLPSLVQNLWAFNWVAKIVAFSSAWTGKTAPALEIPMDHQSREIISKPHEYEEISEPGVSPFRGYGSPRPTDQQYGISVTTNIVVSESYIRDPTDPTASCRHPWADNI